MIVADLSREGSTLRAAADLLATNGAAPVALLVAMRCAGLRTRAYRFGSVGPLLQDEGRDLDDGGKHPFPDVAGRLVIDDHMQERRYYHTVDLSRFWRPCPLTGLPPGAGSLSSSLPLCLVHHADDPSWSSSGMVPAENLAQQGNESRRRDEVQLVRA